MSGLCLDRVGQLTDNSGVLHPVSRVVDRLDPALNRIRNMDVEGARRRVLTGDPGLIREIDGSFALVAADGIAVRLARSMDRPMRYFLAKRRKGRRCTSRIALMPCAAPLRKTAWRTSSIRAIGAVAAEIVKWLRGIDARAGSHEPVGSAFSGGIDTGRGHACPHP